MNSYRVKFESGHETDHHANSIVEALKKVELWEEMDSLVSIQKVSAFNNSFWDSPHIDIDAYDNREVRVFFDYQPYERMTYVHPGCEESRNITVIAWEDTRQELTEAEVKLLEENYGPLDEYIVSHFNDIAMENACG
jgi:hypothetical protein